MNKVDRNKIGLILGSFAALVHIVWGGVVALNWAQPFLTFIFKMHFLANPYGILPFDIATALELVLIASIVGYIAGFVLATIWNHFHR